MRKNREEGMDPELEAEEVLELDWEIDGDEIVIDCENDSLYLDDKFHQATLKILQENPNIENLTLVGIKIPEGNLEGFLTFLSANNFVFGSVEGVEEPRGLVLDGPRTELTSGPGAAFVIGQAEVDIAKELDIKVRYHHANGGNWYNAGAGDSDDQSIDEFLHGMKTTPTR